MMTPTPANHAGFIIFIVRLSPMPYSESRMLLMAFLMTL